MKKANQEKRPQLWLQVLIVAFTLAAVAAAILFGRQTYRETRELATEQFNRQQLILARSAAAGIETFIADVDDDLLALSNFPAVQSMEPGILGQMEILYRGIPPQTSSRRLDENGILRFIYPNEGWRADLTGRDYSQEAYFQEVKESGEVVISELVINEAGERRILVARPVYGEGGEGDRKFNGVIIGSFDPDMLASLYISPIISGETGYAWLLNEDGIILAHHEEEFVGRDAFEVRAETNPELSYEAINDIQRWMMAGEEGVGRYVSGWHRGQSREIEKLVAYAPVQVGNHIWSVAVCAPVDEVERITSAAHRNEVYSLSFIILTLTAAGGFFFVAFYRWARSLQQEIEIRTQAEERIVHLNAVLRAIRNVNQLIVREKDRGRLLQGACDNLIETRGYHTAWIALLDESGGLVTAAEVGLSEAFPSWIKQLKRGELIECGREALAQPGVVTIEDPLSTCAGCPLAEYHSDNGVMAIRLEHSEKIYGLLAVSIPGDLILCEDEHSLLQEVAGDVAFALYNIELEQQRVRAVEALRESEARYRDLIESTYDMIQSVAPDGHFVFVNRAWLETLGYTETELPNLNLWKIIHPESLSHCRKTFSRIMTGEAVKGVQTTFVAKDGRAILVEGNVTGRYTDDKLIATHGFFRDITERVRAEQALQETQRYTRGLIESSLDALVTISAEGRITDVNQATELLTGISRQEIIGTDFSNYFTGPDAARKGYQRVFRDGYVLDYPLEIKHRDGKTTPVLYNASVYKDAQGSVAGVFAAARDITERKQAEEQIQRQLAFLRALHTIDRAISASVDINLTIGVFLDQVLTQLEIDAADVLLFNPIMHTLECAGRKGFRTSALEHTRLRLGQGLAGQVALHRELMYIPDLQEEEEILLASPDLSREAFVAYYGIPLIAKGVLKGVLEIFHRAPLSSDDEWLTFLNALASQAAIAIDNAKMFTDLERSNLALGMAYDSTLEGWAKALELKDVETEGHSHRVVDLTMQLARQMGIGGKELVHIRRGALLHDIGKMGVPDSILQKPGKLTEEEWQIMRKHPGYAFEWLSSIEYLRPALDIPYSHHEKWDGSGYPRGLEGEQIPLAARIFAIVDVWDALRSDRPYRQAWSDEKSRAYIQEQAGKHFDPKVVEAFLEVIGEQ